MYELKVGWQDMHTIYNAVLNAYGDAVYDDPDNEDEAALLMSARFVLEGAKSVRTGRTFGDALVGEDDD